MIRLDDTYIKNSPIQSSKGNQFKWERDGVWYKADYPMGEDIIELIPLVKAKTLSSDFMEQLDVAEKLYGQKLYFTYLEKMRLCNSYNGDVKGFHKQRKPVSRKSDGFRCFIVI